MKITENQKLILGALGNLPDGKGFAKDVLAVVKDKTFNAVNATLASLAGKGLVTKAKEPVDEKILTAYTITDAGKAVLVPEVAE